MELSPMPTPAQPTAQRPSRNRKLRQRRPWRARLPSWRGVRGGVARAARRGSRVLLGLGVAAALAVAGVAAHHFVMTSPRFALREVAIAGSARFGRDELLARAGVRLGTSLFAVSPRDIEERLGRDPWIAGVEARRRLPDGLELRLVERRAAALLVIDGAGLFLADTEGRPFKRAAVHQGEGDGLVVVSGIDRRLYRDGGEPAAALVRLALRIADGWARGTRPPLGEIHLARGGVTLHTLHGATAIALGRPSSGPDGDAELAATLRRFDAIWTALPPVERAAVRRIALDSRVRPDRVTVSLATPEKVSP
jgi:cell division protein FtsQ